MTQPPIIHNGKPVVPTTTITIETTLPCGCELKHVFSDMSGPAPDHRRFLVIAQFLLERVIYWCKSRRVTHKCELVKPGNSAGRDDTIETKQLTIERIFFQEKTPL